MKQPPENLASLMRQANSGDAAAYRRLLETLAPRLRAMARRGLARTGRGSEDAEDIVQETLLAIHLKRHTWDERQPLEPWVRAIAHHKLVDVLRRQGFREHVDIADYADVLSDGTDGRVTEEIDRARLVAALPERQRQVVEGVSLEGRCAREVGERLGMTEGAVRVTLHRACKSLAAAYRRDRP